MNNMKSLKYLFIFFLLSCSSNANDLSDQNSDSFPFSITNEKILFIGNSFTFYWNLPSQVQKMSVERGLNWEVKHFTSSSATLKIHFNNPELKSLLENEKFDHIILQEHSTGPLTDPESSRFYFGQILSLIPSTTKVHFFSTWMYPAIESLNSDNQVFPIEESIKKIVDGTNTSVIPIGRAFRTFQDKYPDYNLLTDDNKHPSPNGTYLASCVIFSHLSAESSKNLSRRFKGVDSLGNDIYYSIVESEISVLLQEIADDVIF